MNAELSRQYSHLSDELLWELQVGKAFADDDDIIIAKMDATANDVVSPKFDVSFCPIASWGVAFRQLFMQQ